MVMLNRKFSSPKRKDAEQWRKVQLLVEHGFYFFSVYRTASNGKKIPVPYPERLADVAAFAREFNSQSALRSKGPSLKSPSASTSNSSDA
jgi:hypothetical protein